MPTKAGNVGQAESEGSPEAKLYRNKIDKNKIRNYEYKTVTNIVKGNKNAYNDTTLSDEPVSTSVSKPRVKKNNINNTMSGGSVDSSLE